MLDFCENDVIVDSPLALPTLIKFDCFKSYEESSVYLKGESAVRFSYLYHYATLMFNSNLMPKLSMDGNYYDIPESVKSTCGDVLTTDTDILINEYRLRTRVEAIFEKNDSLLMDSFLLSQGFIPVNMSMMYGKGVQVAKPLLNTQTWATVKLLLKASWMVTFHLPLTFLKSQLTMTELMTPDKINLTVLVMLVKNSQNLRD